MYMHFTRTEAKLFNLYYSSVPILKNVMKLKLQGLQKRDDFKKRVKERITTAAMAYLVRCFIIIILNMFIRTTPLPYKVDL